MIGICNILWLAIIVAKFTSAMANQYCDMRTCKRRNVIHSMCKYPQGPSQNCPNWSARGLTNHEKEVILRMHNELRRKVASGQELRGAPGPQPAATSMPNLTWDDELEIIAQRWADQCSKRRRDKTRPPHDDCRDSKRFKVGQNVATGYGHKDWKVGELVQGWYDEVELFDKNQVDHFDPPNFKAVGHYGQFCWGTTTTIGCGRMKYIVNGDPHHMLVCNYGPMGNTIGQKMYEKK